MGSLFCTSAASYCSGPSGPLKRSGTHSGPQSNGDTTRFPFPHVPCSPPSPPPSRCRWMEMHLTRVTTSREGKVHPEPETPKTNASVVNPLSRRHPWLHRPGWLPADSPRPAKPPGTPPPESFALSLPDPSPDGGLQVTTRPEGAPAQQGSPRASPEPPSPRSPVVGVPTAAPGAGAAPATQMSTDNSNFVRCARAVVRRWCRRWGGRVQQGTGPHAWAIGGHPPSTRGGLPSQKVNNTYTNRHIHSAFMAPPLYTPLPRTNASHHNQLSERQPLLIPPLPITLLPWLALFLRSTHSNFWDGRQGWGCAAPKSIKCSVPEVANIQPQVANCELETRGLSRNS